GVLRTMWLTKMRFLLILSLLLGGAASLAGVILGQAATVPPTNQAAVGAVAEAQQGASEAKPAAAKDKRDPQPEIGGADGPWKKTLANGVTIELAGISRHPVTPRNWWQPDGTRLAESPNKSFSSSAPEGRHVFFVRLGGLPMNPIGYRCLLSGSDGGQGLTY